MKIKPIGLAVLTFAIIFGGIGLAQLAGWWHTAGEGGRGNGKSGLPVVAGDYMPDDIRGSFSFQTIATAFSIEPVVLLEAFGLPKDLNPASIRSRDLESLYAHTGIDIGNGSVKLFISLLEDLPLAAESDSYLPATAIAIIRQARPDLSADELTILASRSVDASPDLSNLGGGR